MLLDMEPLTIPMLEAALADAELRLAKATEAREIAFEQEGQCNTEVNSIRNLIEVARKRAGVRSGAAAISSPMQKPNENGHENSPAAMAAHGESISHINWIATAVNSSGPRGITPPEILTAAAKAGITMHRNYPYVALKALVKKNRVRKDGDRYYTPK
jgi:hypothetical protein